MRRSMVLALLLACKPPPTPAEVGALWTGGQTAEARAALTRAPDTPQLQAWRALLARYDALAPERAAVRAAERDMLRTAAEEALDAGDFSAASAPLQAGLRAHPDDPDFRALQQRLDDLASAAPPEQAAAAFGALAAIFEHDPERSRRYLLRHQRASLQRRYGDDRFDQTRADQAGIRLDAAHHLLRRIDAEFHIEPPWGAACAEADAHLRALASGAAAQERFPGLRSLAWPAPPDAAPVGLDAVVAHLDAAVATGRAAGLPEEVVIHTWVEGALGGLDPWTRAVWPAEMAAWEQHHAGVTHGVGVILEQTEGGSVRVVRPLPDSPAWVAGLHQDDLLLTLEDDRYVADLQDIAAERRIEVAQMVLRGEPGTPVAVGVARGADRLDFRLERAPVPTPTVEGFARGEDNAWHPWIAAPDGLAYVRIDAFREATEPDFDAMLEPHLDPLRGLILDLRGNPGGDVNAAVQIGDRFVKNGILAELSGRVEPDTGPDIDPETGRKLIPWNHAVPGHALEGVPVVVLVDAETASAAEILAGLLQERAGAVVLGAPTWGKGLAQALRAEPDLGYGVQFSNQVWTLPSGRRLSREVSGGGGIQPDLPESLSPAERFQARQHHQERTALRVHADGTPMRRTDQKRRAELPPLSEDPALVLAELTLRALIAAQAGA